MGRDGPVSRSEDRQASRAAHIGAAVAGSQSGESRDEGNAHRMLVQLEDAGRRSMDEVLDRTLRTPDDGPEALRPRAGDHVLGAACGARRSAALSGTGTSTTAAMASSAAVSPGPSAMAPKTTGAPTAASAEVL